ncbi:MAG: 50S ribosomal protein L6 [Cyanobacteria bacterium QS_8_64_29]|nr:MAG: 50S ribosomal protein L6 [Cyanobacteria bacterium QS_8_64_29]
MSRIGKRPIPLPEGVSVEIEGRQVTVKGPKGERTRQLPAKASLEQADGTLHVRRQDDSRTARERHGLTRTLVANMVHGVSQGFTQRLQLQGVGYRAQVQGRTLVLNVGFSQPVQIEPPEGIDLAVEGNATIAVSGIDKETVGNLAAKIRDVRPPEPYKGKGIRYQDERIRRKAGKAGK